MLVSSVLLLLSVAELQATTTTSARAKQALLTLHNSKVSAHSRIAIATLANRNLQADPFDPNVPGLVRCLESDGVYICVHEDMPLPDLADTGVPSYLALVCDTVPEAEPTNANCIPLVVLGKDFGDDIEDNACIDAAIAPTDSLTDGDWDYTYDCSNLNFSGACITKTATGCVASGDAPPESGPSVPVPDDEGPSDPSTSIPGLDSCVQADSGRYVCVHEDVPLPDLADIGVPSYLALVCDTVPKAEPTNEDCDVLVVLGKDIGDDFEDNACIDAAIAPTDSLTDGDWDYTYDCSNLNFNGACITKTATGCVASGDAPPESGPSVPVPDDEGPSNPITSISGLDCVQTDSGRYLCFHEDVPLPDLADTGVPSFLTLLCDTVPEAEPTNEDCGALVVLGKDIGDDLEDADYCIDAAVAPTDSLTDGDWDYTYDCSNLNFSGACITKTATGCVASGDAPPESGPSVPVPDDEGPSNTITSIPGLDSCVQTDSGRYVCYHEDVPLPDLADTGVPSYLVLVCDTLDTVEPTNEDCGVLVVLGKDIDEDFEDADYCIDAAIAPTDSLTDGDWDYTYDCSNHNFNGACITKTATGCVASGDAPGGGGTQPIEPPPTPQTNPSPPVPSPSNPPAPRPSTPATDPSPPTTSSSSSSSCPTASALELEYDACLNNKLSTIAKGDCEACLINGLDEFLDDFAQLAKSSCAVIQDPICALMAECGKFCGACSSETDNYMQCLINLPELIPGCTLQCEAVAIGAADSSSIRDASGSASWKGMTLGMFFAGVCFVLGMIGS